MADPSTSKSYHDDELERKEPPERVYDLDPLKPGKIFIINCVFEPDLFNKNIKLGKRNGTDKDRKSIKTLFKKINCDISIIDSPKHEDWNKYVEKFKTRCTDSMGSFIAVFVLTHGSKYDTLYTDDGFAINLFQDVVYPFNNKNLPQYIGRPKLFFIQACNNEIDSKTCSTSSAAISVGQDHNQHDTSKELDNKVLGVLEDVFLGRASIPFAPSTRHTDDGSPYIQSLCTVIDKYWKQLDLERMHKEAVNDMKKNFSQTANHTLYDFRKFFFCKPLKRKKLLFQVQDPVFNFTGRENFLFDLHRSIQDSRKKGQISVLTQTSSITGMGGVGKTATLRMYIQKFGEKYDDIVWINAEYNPEIKTQMENLAFKKLHIDSNNKMGLKRELSDVLEQLYEKLCETPNLLLIVFDNAELFKTIHKFLPQQSLSIEVPVVLITSRQQDWKDMNIIELGLWTTEECIEYICKSLRQQDTVENKEIATKLADLFDRLPIAIEVAVSAIAEQKKRKQVSGSGDYGIENFIHEYNAGSRKVLKKQTKLKKRSAHNEVVMETLLNVSFDQIKAYDDGDLAIRILVFMAFLSPTNIPKSMVRHLLQDGNDDESFEEALVLLTDYSIIKSIETYFTIHRVFQDILIIILPDLKLNWNNNVPVVAETKDKVSILTDLTNKITAYTSCISPTHDAYSEIVTNIVHVTNYIIKNAKTLEFYTYIEIVADFVKDEQFESAVAFYTALIDCDINMKKLPIEKTFEKQASIGGIYYSNERYQKSLDIFNELLDNQMKALHEKTTNEDTLPACNSKYYIALCIMSLGRTKEALKLLHELYGEVEKITNPLNAFILGIKFNIANCLQAQGDTVEALILFQTVQKSEVEIYGDRHASTLATKGRIACCLCDLGQKEKALGVFKAIQQVWEQVNPLDKRNLCIRYNVGVLLGDIGRPDEAITHLKELQKDQEKVFGVLHRSTLETKIKIADLSYHQDKKEEALELYKAVQEDQEEILGPHHPDILNTKAHKAIIIHKLGRNEEALNILEPALKEQINVLGELHAATLRNKMCLGSILLDLGKWDKAFDIYEAVEKDQETVIGLLHPHTLETKQNKAIAERILGRTEEAFKHFQSALKDFEKVYGPLHPTTLGVKTNVVNCLIELGKIQEALELNQVLEKQLELVLGPHHPTTLKTKMSKADCLAQLGKVEETLRLNEVLEKEMEEAYGNRHPTTLMCKANKAYTRVVLGEIDEAWDSLKAVCVDQESVLGTHHPDTTKTKFYIVEVLIDLGKTDEALKLYNTLQDNYTKDRGLTPLHILRSKMKAAVSLSKLCRHAEALSLYQDILNESDQVLGKLDTSNLETKINMVRCLHQVGRKDEAVKFAIQVNEELERASIPLQPHLVERRRYIASLLRSAGKTKDALKIYNTLHDYQMQILGTLHEETLDTKICLADCLSKLGKEEDALKLNYSLLDVQVKVLGPAHSQTSLTRINLANSLSALGKKEEALKHYYEVYDILMHTQGPQDEVTLAAKSNLAVCVGDLGKKEEALKLFDAVLKDQEEFLGPHKPGALLAKMNKANCLSDIGNAEEAFKLFSLVEKDIEKAFGPEHPHTLLTKMNIATLLKDQGRKEEALALFLCVQEQQEKVQGPLFPGTLVTKMNVAVCLSDLGLKDEALDYYHAVEKEQEKVIGSEHPHIKLTRSNIASHSSQGKENSLRLYFID